MEQIVFYILAIVILVFSLLAVTSKRILRAAVYMLFTLIGTAGIYFLFNYDFLAAVQITVYAGGVVVLVIFSILLTSQLNTDLDSPSMMKQIVTGLVCFMGALLCISIIATYEFDYSKLQATGVDTSVQNIGTRLLSYSEGGYVLPFEVISVLLLAAMIAAIVISKRDKKIDGAN